MSLWSLVVVVLVAVACTKPNPRSCQDGTCTDPALPFCDIDGALAGEEQTCIAVACTANEFVACRGDRAITCNTTGTDYELELCSGGCSEAAGGCRRCEPNETVCENGQVQTCDSDGAVIASEVCPLGCFEDQPRCREIDPSNNLGRYVDMVPAPQDLDLSGTLIITNTGVVELQGNAVAGIAHFLQPAAGNGAAIRVIVARDVRLADVTFATSSGSGPSLAILATGSLIISGRVTGLPGAGAMETIGCSGGAGESEIAGGSYHYAGHGGGGHATPGAKGGDIPNRGLFGGGGGIVSGTDNLVPLRGGCGSGRTSARGGSALQLSSRKSVVVDGVVDLRGAPQGGGGGGGLLIEAPVVELKANARLLATGGGGHGGGHFADQYSVPPRTDDGGPDLGTACMPSTSSCTPGGNGAAPGVPATPGTNTSSSQTLMEIGAGGGGGGLGRIRINTPNQIYIKTSSVIEAGVTTVGTLSSR
ncbi:MAG: hypothetical protein H0T42_02735 [Deltaproteobacteria bacterium]|nr:hypothetical protein [Deltaproteobacteria bacterium]